MECFKTVEPAHKGSKAEYDFEVSNLKSHYCPDGGLEEENSARKKVKILSLAG